jgi:hypothetical protein
MGSKKRCSDDDILNQMLEYYKKNNKISQYGFSKDKTVCDPGTVIDRFGSWEKAVKKAGIPLKVIKNNKKKSNLSKEEKREKIKKKVKSYIVRTGKLPMASEYTSWNELPSLWHVNKLFGNKNQLYTELGYTNQKHGEILTKEQIITKIQKFYKKEGREPRIKEFSISNDLPNNKNIEEHFNGKAAAAKRAAGFKLALREKEYTVKEAIKALQAFYEREGRVPIKNDMKAENDLPSIIKLRSIFGTLRAAREAAGFELFGVKKPYIIKEDLEKLLVEEYKKQGRRLKNIEIIENRELPTPSTVKSILRVQRIEKGWEYIEKKYKLHKK